LALPAADRGWQVVTEREGKPDVRFTALIALCAALLLGAGLGATTGSADDTVPTAPTSTEPAPPTDTDTGTTTTTPAPEPTVPEIAWGAADDASKFAEDGGAWFYEQLKGAHLTQNRWTVGFDQSNPTVIKELPFLERAAPQAQAAGIRVIVSLYSIKGSEHNPVLFCEWAKRVVQTLDQWGIHDFIVGNEVNTRLYWSPQKNARGRDVAAPAYLALLARCYDGIHAVDPEANVIGMGLSPRASTAESNEPLVFLRDVGKAYRASGRTRPIMDQLSVHPYPSPSSPTDGPWVGYANPNRFGVPNLDRVKQAVYDAFNGTGQPTTLDGLTFIIDEIGWQTDTSAMRGYVNAENVNVLSEQKQADYMKEMISTYVACDPTVTGVQLFLLVDEKYRNGRDETNRYVGGGWQSGLLTTGGEGVSQPKRAYTAAGALFAQGRAACTGPLISWWPGKASSGANPGKKLVKKPLRRPRRK
jgi:hypothetical protein